MTKNPPPLPDPDKDPIVQAVVRLNAAWSNKNYAKHNPTVIRGANVYKVTFEGQEGGYFENYVFQRGMKDPIPYSSLGELLNAKNNDLIPDGPNLELVRLVAVVCFTLMFGAAVIYVVVQPTENKSVQILTGFVGLGLGYLVGKSPEAGKKDGSN